jgi:hypothetical protein
VDDYLFSQSEAPSMTLFMGPITRLNDDGENENSIHLQEQELISLFLAMERFIPPILSKSTVDLEQEVFAQNLCQQIDYNKVNFKECKGFRSNIDTSFYRLKIRVTNNGMVKA